MLNPQDVQAKLGAISDVTHLVFAAYMERPTNAELIEPNIAMLRNLLDVVEKHSRHLRHATLFQGGKAYGDYFRWRHLWPAIARCFEMEIADPLPLPLTEFMADKGPVWEKLVQQNGLQSIPYEQIASWRFGVN